MRAAFQHDIDYSKRQRDPGVLIGVRTICRYMQISAPTFYKLQTAHGLPAMRLPGGRWCTSKNLIDEWIISRWKAQKWSLDHIAVESRELQVVSAVCDQSGTYGAAPHMGREQAV